MTTTTHVPTAPIPDHALPMTVGGLGRRKKKGKRERRMPEFIDLWWLLPWCDIDTGSSSGLMAQRRKGVIELSKGLSLGQLQPNYHEKVIFEV
jgi:hypothetical protein